MATLCYYWKIALKIHPNTFSSSFPLEVYLLVVVVIPIRSSFLGNIFCDDVIRAGILLHLYYGICILPKLK